MSVTNHLANPWNDGKPVRIGRDGQEMPSNVGQELVDIIEESAEAQHVSRPGMRHPHIPPSTLAVRILILTQGCGELYRKLGQDHCRLVLIAVCDCQAGLLRFAAMLLL